MTTSTNNCCPRCYTEHVNFTKGCINPDCPCHTEKHRPNTMIRQDWFDIPEKPAQENCKKCGQPWTQHDVKHCGVEILKLPEPLEIRNTDYQRIPMQDGAFAEVMMGGGSEQSMEERFDALFPEIYIPHPEVAYFARNLKPEIKAFITAEVQKAETRGASNALLNMAANFPEFPEAQKMGATKERQRIVALVEGLRETEPHHASSLYSFKRGKNSMLDAVLRSIQEPKE